MKHNALSLDEAHHLCQCYGELAKRVIGNYERDVLEQIVVAPYDKLNKHLFLEIYKETHCPMKSLEFYKGTAYDVLAIFRVKDKETELYFRELQPLLDSHNIDAV